MKFRTVYSAREESRKDKKAVTFTEDSLTDQNFKDETDVNMILSKYKVTRNPAVLGLGADGQPLGNPKYGDDYADIGTYQDCLEVVMQAEEQFMQLPASIRKEVGNTPEGMLKWIQDPNNYERGVELGIFEKRVESLDNASNSNNLDSPIGVPSVVDDGNKVTPQ